MKRQKVMDDDLYLMANIPIHRATNMEMGKQEACQGENREDLRDETKDKNVPIVSKSLRRKHSLRLVELLKIYLRKGKTGMSYFDTRINSILEWMDINTDEIKKNIDKHK
jgi:hypothetical protein